MKYAHTQIFMEILFKIKQNYYYFLKMKDTKKIDTTLPFLDIFVLLLEKVRILL